MRHRGLSWARTTFFRASTGRYHSTSSQPVSTPGGTRTRRPPVESRRSWPLEDGSVRCHAEPSSGIEPEPPEYETGARPVELQGQVAPAEGVEPSRVRLTAGCPTVRPRWNDRGAARARRRDDPRIGASMLRAASRTTRAVPLTSQLIGAEFSMNRAPCRRTSPFVAFLPNADLLRRGVGFDFEAWFRAQDSNLRFWVQRPVSCRLDDPGMSCDLRAAVGPEGFEPSPHRLRAEYAPITPRTRCLAPSVPKTWDARDSNPHLSG